MHIVHYDADQRIEQIRLYWDQGSLLKQIDIIGARARSWPIRDGKDQARLIATSASASDSNSRPSTAASNISSREPGVSGKPRSQSNNVTRDPHAGLALFTPRNEYDEDSAPAVTASRASAKPPPRNYHDLFVGNDPDASSQAQNRSSASPKKENSMHKTESAKPPPRNYHDLFVGNESGSSTQDTDPTSPRKELMSPPVLAKSGAGKSYKPSRLFDTEENDPATPQPRGNYMKPDPKKYSHFEFGNGDDVPAARADRPKTKHQNTWDFEDFATPQKLPTRFRPGDQDKRHFGWEDGEANMDSPDKHPVTNKPRPDATANFEFRDDGPPPVDHRPPGHALGGTNFRNTGLYQDNILSENDQGAPGQERKHEPLSTVTNLKDRRQDFDPHFTISDHSPSQSTEPISKSIPEARGNQMGAQMETTDASSAAPSKGNAKLLSSNDKENFGPKNVGIKSGGDGMGGKKGAGRSWGFGNESDEDGVSGGNGGKFQAAKKQQAPKESGFWDF